MSSPSLEEKAFGAVDPAVLREKVNEAMTVAWEAIEPLAEAEDVRPLAVVLHALSTPRRLRIIQRLLQGPARRGDLRIAAGYDPSSSLQALENAGIVERVWFQGDHVSWQLVTGALPRISEALRPDSSDGPHTLQRQPQSTRTG